MAFALNARKVFHVSADVVNEEFVIAFNSKFLADALGFVQTEDVELRIQDQLRAANFAQTDSCYVLMPVRQF